MSIGPMELVVILAVVLLFFGPKRLPGLGKALGEGIKSFKDGISSDKKEGIAQTSDTNSEKKS